MITVQSYPLAVLMCFITMLCWGSWGSTQKLASKEWRFQLFYWDYAIGVLLFSLILAFTMGSYGEGGRGFLADVSQANGEWIGSAVTGGVVFNISNILLVAAIDIAGLAVAFPVGVGLALVVGVITTYMATGEGNVPMLAVGVGLIAVAIVLSAMAYYKLDKSRGEKSKSSTKGIVMSIAAGLLMGFFYKYVAQAMGSYDAATGILEAGKLSPYTAVVFFSIGLLVSNFVFNGLMIPNVGSSVDFGDYFRKGSARLHAVGIFGGMIWSCGMNFNIIAAPAADPALAYGLGQGATLVSALWGVFIWKEFKNAPAGTHKILGFMFLCFVLGLGVLVASKL